MKTVMMADPVRYPRMTTAEIRETFLLNGLCEPGKLIVNYVDLDRAVVGFAAPTDSALALPTYPELRAEYFLERRELGVLNTSGVGTVSVDGKDYELNNLDVLYISKGKKDVKFASKDKANPAAYYLLSYPAHAEYPVAVVRKEEASPVELGSVETCNKRTIVASIFTCRKARSCQLVMGVTHLSLGSNWNIDAAARAHAALGDLHVLQRGGRCARGPPDGTAGRDAASVAGQPRRGGIAGMVDSCGCGHAGGTALRDGAWAARTRTMRIWIRHLVQTLRIKKGLGNRD